MPLGSEKTALLGAAGGGGGKFSSGGNYLGNEEDGDLSTSGDVTLTVLNTNGSYDGDMIVRNYKNLTVNTGHTLKTSQPCRGLLIYVSENCTIDGSIDMGMRGGSHYGGCNADPTASGGSDSSAVSATGLRYPVFTSGGSETLAAADFAGCGTAAVEAVANQPAISGNGTILTVSRVGGAGAAGVVNACCGSDASGGTGASGATDANTISTGGGGSGAARHTSPTYSGAGGQGSCFSGGSGGGGCHGAAGTTPGTPSYGGQGGQGGGCSGCSAGGGAGNPGGSPHREANSGSQGTGGLIWLIVGGNVSGNIYAQGNHGGGIWGGGSTKRGGAGSAGGAIHVMHVGSSSVSLSLQGGDGSNSGGYGGTGGYRVTQITQRINNVRKDKRWVC